MKLAIIDTLGLTYDGDTLNKRGLGGSESAVILISKELSKIGFDVTVFNNCIDSEAKPGIYGNVEYVDHTNSSKYDNEVYDIVISSRSVWPFWANNKYAKITSNAKYRVLWMHDTFCSGDEHIESMVSSGYLNEVFTLSDWHTSYVTTSSHGPKRMFEVMKKSLWQTRNGAVKWIDEVDVKEKDKDLFVYNASATKGLLPLLKNIWPEVKKQIPTAKLKCIGGFYRFRDGAEPDEQEKTVRQLMQDESIKALDVEFTGVIPQYEIAKILAKASFMLYPPDFPETFGISSLESLLYKTPIITGNFGALEETAFDEACYKINYPAVPNGLYPHINEQEQTKKFVEITVRAYHNRYLLQQKQNLCEVINDVYGWDSVALEWKQHFYRVFEKFLPVYEYRKVSEITDKVNRVFGRRYHNKESTSRYTSYGKQRRIVIISPFWNAKDYLENHVRSVASQDYDNYIHILIDDNSTDNGQSVIYETLKDMSEDIRSRTIIRQNKKNLGAIQNQIDAINDFVKYDDIVMLLDGDDWLVPNNTIFHYYNSLYNKGHDFSYGSMWSLADNIPLVAQDYPSKVKSEGSYRQHKFNWGIPYTHLRTFSGEIALHLDEDVFKDENGNWMMAGADNPLFYETIERAYNPVVVKEIVAVYNDKNPLNDYKVRSKEQNRNANMKSEKHIKKILIAVPTNKYIEPETMKSIYDLKVPEGYTTEFQFFYGYQIDQIRNLIAEWAKRYDYLFSVDSDIVLPSDSLEKMLKADKDIVSGLYIQRIPNTHKLEIYIETPNGGVANVPNEIAKDFSPLQEIAGCGFGCCLIKSEIFKNMEYPHFYYRSALDHKDTISEDIYFCKKARSMGYKIWADMTIKCDHIGNTRYQVNLPEESHLEKIAKQDLLPKEHADYLKSMDLKPKVVYDIGACVLHWTRKAKEAWPDAKYFLIDAASSVVPFLDKSGHSWASAVLSDKDDKIISFYEDTQNPGGNSYYKETTGAYTENHRTERKTIKLDTLRKNNNWPLPDLIKMDVQGAELDVLKGAIETLSNNPDIILEAQHVDYNEGAPKINEVLNYMSSIGYKCVSNFCKGGVDGDYHFRKL